MVTVTLSRGGTSVTLSLDEERSGLVVARDIGKPSQSITSVGREDPRFRDDLSAVDHYTVFGRLTSSSAYADAQTLAEDLIKTRSGTALELDLSNLPSGQTHTVAPVSEAAATITYEPGTRNNVPVQLSLAVVDSDVKGSTQDATAAASPDAGSGVKLTDESNPITLSDGLSIERTVGRPDDTLLPTASDLPNYYARAKSASDVFDISAANLTEANALTLEETLVRARKGDTPLTLHFLSNLYSLDAYKVVPVGTQALRTSFATGATGDVNVDALKLRVVDVTAA